jgi:uncharacterized protein YndB with AHSA1/START domain
MSGEREFKHTGRVIRDEIRIAASPETIYQAWSDPGTVTGWFVSRMEGRMGEGETVEWFWSAEDPGMSQRVLAAEPPHRLVTAMDLPEGVSYLEVTIEQDGGHSVLRLVQSGFGEGPDWDDECEAMLSGWMVALAILKFFVERYVHRRRREILVLADAPFGQEEILELQRTEEGLARWLARSGAPGRGVGEPVRIVLENGTTLTGTVLRNTAYETLWSWDEIEGVVEIKAFRGARWGSKVGIRISSWKDDFSELSELKGWVTTVVGRLTALLTDTVS